MIEIVLLLPEIACKISSQKSNSSRRVATNTKNNNTRTVIIVGGNFAGLAALRELLAWQKNQDDLNIVLIDQRDYSEYTPGILRLFCEPGRFFQMAQALPETSPSCNFVRIEGTVTSIVAEDPLEQQRRTKMKKVVTYVPTNATAFVDEDPNNVESLTPTKTQSYDYLILATGATYCDPISPATPKVGGRPTPSTFSLAGRYKEWEKAHEKLKGAKRVLILGGGAVGVELAAEILDHASSLGNQNTSRNNTFGVSVTIVDAQTTLVPLFPRAVGAYAEDWLSQRGADLRLGESLHSWNDRSCTLSDGTVLQADVVYVCFGNRPNSEMIAGSDVDAEERNQRSSSSQGNGDKFFSLTRRRNVVVKDTLQLAVRNHDEGGDSEFSNTPWFACGDVASPPSNDEKQAFQAEVQGKLAAKNVIKMIEPTLASSGPRLYKYPQDISGSDTVPLVFVLSLGKHDGVLGFNSLCIRGPLAAIVKWILEHTKVSQMRGRLLGNLIWKIGDAVVFFLSRTLLPSPSSSSAVVDAAATAALPTNTDGKTSAIPVTLSFYQRSQHRQLEEQLKLS